MQVRQLILMCIFLLAGIVVRAQYFYTYWVIPSNPTTQDSIILVDSLTLVYQSMHLYYSDVTVSDSFFTISQCYNHAGGIAVGRNATQYTALGRFSAGAYTGVIYSHVQYDSLDTDCSQYGIRDSIRFSFTVTEPTGLHTIPQTDFILTPNPTSGQLFLSHQIDDAQLTVQDLNGRTYHLPQTGREIDVSSLAPGVYVLRLQTKEGSIVRRFVRE